MFKKRNVKKIQVSSDEEEQGTDVIEKSLFNNKRNTTINSKSAPLKSTFLGRASLNQNDDEDEESEDEITGDTFFLKKNKNRNTEIPVFKKNLVNIAQYENQEDTSVKITPLSVIEKKAVQEKPSTTMDSSKPKFQQKSGEILNLEDLDDQDEEVFLNENQEARLKERQSAQQVLSGTSVAVPTQRQILKEEKEYINHLNQDDLEELNSIYNKGKKSVANGNISAYTLGATGEDAGDANIAENIDQAVVLDERYVEDNVNLAGMKTQLALSEQAKKREQELRKKIISEQISMTQDHVVHLPKLKPLPKKVPTKKILEELTVLKGTLLDELNDIAYQITDLKEKTK